MPVESPNIVLTIAMNNKKLSFSLKRNVRLRNIKKYFLTKLCGHEPTSEELSNYYLSHKDNELDESKQIGELHLSSYYFECMLVHKVQVFVEGNNEPHVIKFGKSISVEQIVSTVVGSEFIDSCYATKTNSSIVLKNVISTSLDLTRKIAILYS